MYMLYMNIFIFTFTYEICKYLHIKIRISFCPFLVFFLSTEHRNKMCTCWQGCGGRGLNWDQMQMGARLHLNVKRILQVFRYPISSNAACFQSVLLGSMTLLMRDRSGVQPGTTPTIISDVTQMLSHYPLSHECNSTLNNNLIRYQ